MDFTIIEQPSFKVIGKEIRVSMIDGANMREIPKFWDSLLTSGEFFEIEKAATSAPGVGKLSLGGCFDFDNEKQEFTYLIGFSTDSDAPAAMVSREVPANHWAVFESVGPLPEALQAVWGQVMGAFSPTSEWQHAPNSPDLEVYPEGDARASDYKCYIWVPVVKK